MSLLNLVIDLFFRNFNDYFKNSGIDSCCSNTKHLLCAWHRSLNFRKKFLHVVKTNREIYKKIILLPYEEFVDKYEETYENISNSSALNEQEKLYLKEYNEIKHKWV